MIMKTHPLFNAPRIAVVVSSIIISCGYSAGVENAQAPVTIIPKSIFVVPKDARDPFYPTSTRLSNSGASAKATAPSPVKVSLILNGLSGTSGHRLAMINGRTLAEGESSDVPSGGNFVKVLCVEIKEYSVVVEVGGSRQELSMRGEK